MAGLPGGGPPTSAQELRGRPGKKVRAAAPVPLPPPTAAPAAPTAQGADPDFAFLEGQPGGAPAPAAGQRLPPVLPHVPGTPYAPHEIPGVNAPANPLTWTPPSGVGQLRRFEDEAAKGRPFKVPPVGHPTRFGPVNPPAGDRSGATPGGGAGALSSQLASESLFIDQENHNLKSLEAVIKSGRATAAEVQSYHDRGVAQQERVRHYQALNAQYQGLPAAQVPFIQPRQYSPHPEEAAVAHLEPVYKKWSQSPASPVEIARVKQQYGVAQAALARTFPARLQENQTDGAALKAQGEQLDALVAQNNAGQLSPATAAALRRAVQQHQANVTAFNQHREALVNQSKRFDHFTQGHAHEDLHLGMVYPEEVGGPGPNAAVRAFKATLNFFQPVAAAAARNLPAARRGLQLAGEYPPLPELPANVTGAAREALIRQKNDLVAMVTREQDPTRVAGYSPVATYDARTGQMTHAPGAAFNEAALTPFQRQLLPLVRKQVQAELKAREIAGTEKAGAIDAAALAGSLLVGGVTSRLVGGRLAARFLPLLYPALEAPVLPSVPQVAARLLAARALPVFGASIAGSVTGGATGAAISAGLVGPPQFDPKTGKALTPTPGERAAYAGEAALRSVPPSALIGTLWGAASLLGGTLAPFLARSHYDPETGPATNAAFTAEAEARAAQAGYPLSPEESGRFGQRFGQIQRAPTVLKPKLWRDLAHDWNTFIQQQRLLRPPGEPGPAGAAEPGGLGPPQPQLPGAPRTQFDLPENVGPLVRTPAGQDWDLRTRPAEDIQTLHDQFGQLKAAGQLTPEQDAEYGRLDRWLQGHHDYQAQQALPGATGEAQAAIHTALLEQRPQYGLAALDQAQAAAQGRGDLYLAGELHRALGTQAGVVTQAFNSQLAPPGTAGIEAPLPPLFASVFRTLPPERLAQVPAPARRVLLLQDLNNSIQALEPGAQPFFRPPQGVRSDAELRALADSYYRLASLHLSSLFPSAFQPAPPAAPAAPPEPAAPVAGAPLTDASLVPGAVVQFPNGLTVQLQGPADAGGLAFHTTVMDPGHSSYVAGSTATLARDNLIAGGTLVSPGGAPSAATGSPTLPTPAGESTAPLAAPPETPGLTASSSPTGMTSSPTSGRTGPVTAPPMTPSPAAPVAGPTTPPPAATSAGTSERPLTPADLRPGAVVKSANTGVEGELKERRPDGKWQARVIFVPTTAYGDVKSGSLREIPESALLEPGRYVTSQALPPEEQSSAPETTAATVATAAPTGSPSGTPAGAVTPASPTGGISPPTGTPSPPSGLTTATGTTGPAGPPSPPGVGGTPSAPPSTGAGRSPGAVRSSTPNAPPTSGAASEKAATPAQNELPRPVRLLIDALLDRINARMLADEPIFSNNVEMEQFAAPLLGGSRAAGTYTAQTVYNALEAAVNRYVVEQQFGQQSVGEALKHLQDLLRALPTQTLRAGDKDALQQFSTPPTLALLAAYALRPRGVLLAQGQGLENLLEPSAGTGSLLAMAQSLWGAELAGTAANELDPERRAILHAYFTPEVYAADARYLNATLPHGLTYDLILMNPPFSAAKGQRAKNTNEIGFEHVEQALKRLKEGGRLVAILGRGASFEHSTAMPFWNKVVEQYHVRANAGLPGKDYAKYGTSFATQLVVLDNTGPTPGGIATLWAPELTSVEAAVEGLNERGILVRPEGAGKAPSVGVGPAGEPGTRGAATGVSPRAGRPGGGRGATGRREVMAVPAEPGAPGPALPTGVPGTAPGAPGTVGAEPGGLAPHGDLRPPGDLREPGIAGGATAPGPAGREPDRHVAGAKQYHGTSQGVTLSRAYEQVQYQNLYGPGFYTTDNPEVAKTYTKKGKGKEPVVYEVRWVGPHPPRLLDLNEPLPPELHAAFEAHNSFVAPLDFNQPGRLVYEDLKAGWAGEMLPAADVQEEMHALADALVAAGYDGMSHTGGVGRKLGEHHVVIYFHPVDEKTGQPNLELVPLGEGVVPPPAPISAPKPAPKKARAPEVIQPEERQDIGDQYVSYLPAYVLEGRPHPAIMVETRSLAAVDPPPITVTHSLKEEALYPTAETAAAFARQTGNPAPNPEDLGLSNVQLEVVLYAKQRHAVILADGARGGLLLGDGTGGGKGRSLAAIAADAWENGIRRIIWFSAGAGLMDAAKDDLAAIGYGHIPLKLLNKFPGGEWMPDDFAGIVFSTYATLTGVAKSGTLTGTPRRVVLERWLAAGSDAAPQGTRGEGSLVLMDESHFCKNAVQRAMGPPPSQTATEGMKLQANLPLLRVVYASATAMTELDNMAYLQRLGLWGPGTPWPGGFNDFAVAMGNGGRGYMEMISRDMKARGMYMAREISFKDPEERLEQSVEFRQLQHLLTPEDTRQYALVADAWQVVLQNMEAALDITGGDKSARAKMNAIGAFWSDHQRFFRRFLTALKLPTLFADIDQQLAAGRSVVISLVGTNEKATDDAVRAAADEGLDLDELDLTPIQGLVRLVERAFPVQKHVEKRVEGTDTTTIEPLVDAAGNAVLDPEAVALREALLERLAGITERLPGNPLDEILHRYGHARVAEMTGRQKRLELGPNGETIYVSRGGNSAAVNVVEKNRFNAGEKRIAIISKSANQGISLQAGRRFQNQQRRAQYMFELNWSADSQMQANGRTHRSNQVSAPELVIVNTNAGGETRFAATIARRLASLGALTRGQREATGAGGALDQFDYENDYGRRALELTYQHILRGGQIEGLGNATQALRDMGLLKKDPYGYENMEPTDRTHITRFFNRLLSLDVARQNPLFEAFVARFAALVQQAQDAGEFDYGVQDIRGGKLAEVGAPQRVSTDPATGAETLYHHVTSEEPAPVGRLAEIDRLSPLQSVGFFRRVDDQSLVYVSQTQSPVNPYRVWTPPHKDTARLSPPDLAANFRKVPAADVPAARGEWAAAEAAAPATVTRHYHLIAGAVLPVFDRLKAGRQERFEVKRAKLSGNRRLVGISLQPRSYKAVLKALGATSAALNPADLYEQLLASRDPFPLVAGLSLKAGKRSGTNVVQIQGADYALTVDLQRQGFPSERDAATRRHFLWLPADPVRGPELLAQLLQRFPPLEELPAAVGAAAAPVTVPAPRERGLKVLPPRQVPILAPPRWQIPFATLRWLEDHAASLSAIFRDVAAAGLTPEEQSRAHDYGVLVWPEVQDDRERPPAFVGGFSTGAGLEGLDVGNMQARAVFVNPFPPRFRSSVQGLASVLKSVGYEGLAESDDPDYVAELILDAMLHELAHQREQMHEGEALNTAMRDVIAAIGPAALVELRDRLKREITDAEGLLSGPYLSARKSYYARAGTDRRPSPARGYASAPLPGRVSLQIIGSGGAGGPGGDRGDGGPPARRERSAGAGHRTALFRFPWPGLDRQFTGARPGPKPTRWQEIQAAGTMLRHSLTRPFVHLPVNDPLWSELQARLREFDHGWGIANMQSILYLAQIGEELSPEDYSFFGRLKYALDMGEEVQEQTARILERLGPDATPEQVLAHIQLPQGKAPDEQWTPERAAEADALMRAESLKPENFASVEAREIERLVVDQVMDRLLSAMKKATGKELLITRREWFHHEMLFYAEEYRQARAAHGKQQFAPSTPGFLRRREGSLLDYNSDYIQAMLSWLPTALFDAHAYELMAWMRDRYDVKKELQKAALLINDARAYRQLEEFAAALNAQARRGSPVTAADLYRARYNAPIARGFGWLGRIAYEQRETLPGYDDPRWEDLVEEIAAKWYLGHEAADLGLPVPQVDDEHARTLFDYLRWLLQAPQAGEPGSGAAAMIFKGIAEKKARLKAALGKEHVTWRDLLKHPFEVENGDGATTSFDFTGYVAWQPEEGQALYRAWGVRERIANAVIESGADGLGIPITKDDLRHLRVVGGRKPEWVIPRPLALTLKELRNPVRDEFEKLWGKAASAAKQWILLNPFHYAAYHLRNELTDIEAVGTGNPYSFGYMKAAFLELYDFMWLGKLPSDHLRGWLDRGGVMSTLQAASTDRRSVGTLRFLRQLQEDRSLTDRTWGEAWRRARIAGDLREAVLRYASYLSYLDQMLADPQGRPLNFGASYEADIMAIGDVHLRAYTLSNDLLGAYDQVPALWKQVRKGLPMPFVNWKIVNTRRYMRLMLNEAMTSRNFQATVQWLFTGATVPAGGGAGGAGLPPVPPGGGGGGGEGSDGEDAERQRRLREILRLQKGTRRFGMEWLRRQLQRYGVGLVFLGFIVRWLAKASWMNALAAANNWAFHSDEERRLPPYVRNKPHLDLGFNRYIDRISGFGDALGSFGLDDLGGYWEKWRNGRMSGWDVLGDMLFRQPVQTIVDQVGLPKNVAELAAGVKFFPDFTQPRPIDDKWEYAMTSVGLGNAYRLLWGLPQRGGIGSLGTQGFGLTELNPGESQYNEVRELAFDWAHQHGFGDIHTSGQKEKSQNAYFYKKCLKNGDPASGLKFLLRYRELDGDDKGLGLSLKYMYPLYRWPEGQRRQFLLSMKGQEPTRWRNAMLFLYQSLAPKDPVDQGELDQKMQAPLEDFDRWAWSRIEAQIDRGGFFADVDRLHPEARAAGEKYKAKVEGR